MEGSIGVRQRHSSRAWLQNSSVVLVAAVLGAGVGTDSEAGAAAPQAGRPLQSARFRTSFWARRWMTRSSCKPCAELEAGVLSAQGS